MTEHELRALVRDAISRHLAGATGTSVSHRPGETSAPHFPARLAPHPSHGLYRVPEGDGPCIIEPAVMCNHCGYCKSHGH